MKKGSISEAINHLNVTALLKLYFHHLLRLKTAISKTKTSNGTAKEKVQIQLSDILVAWRFVILSKTF